MKNMFALFCISLILLLSACSESVEVEVIEFDDPIAEIKESGEYVLLEDLNNSHELVNLSTPDDTLNQLYVVLRE